MSNFTLLGWFLVDSFSVDEFRRQNNHARQQRNVTFDWTVQ